MTENQTTEIQEEPVIIEHTWTDRVLEEKNILQNKILALTSFTSTEEYKELEQSAQLLLQAQLSVMVTYSQLLTLRLTTNLQGDYSEN